MNTVKEAKLIIRLEYAHTRQEQEVRCLMTPTFKRKDFKSQQRLKFNTVKQAKMYRCSDACINISKRINNQNSVEALSAQVWRQQQEAFLLGVRIPGLKNLHGVTGRLVAPNILNPDEHDANVAPHTAEKTQLNV